MNINFDNKEERVILLPVPIGAKVWRVHKAYIPKTNNKSIYCGWDKAVVYDEEKYDLSMYNMVDIYFSEESARLAAMKKEQEND